MVEKLPTLAQLLKQLQNVPYLASKNLYRVTNHFLSMDDVRIQHFCKTILEAKRNIVPCQVCYTWKEKDKECLICSDPKRDPSIICVVETWQELLTIEKAGGYTGFYHVLGGAICPLEGVGPDDLTLYQLIDRVNDAIKEVILATNQTPEGEATAAFIASKLKVKQVKVSCLARGIPVGSSLEYMDRVTVHKALTERRPF
jgi:recombination protein RecR